MKKKTMAERVKKLKPDQYILLVLPVGEMLLTGVSRIIITPDAAITVVYQDNTFETRPDNGVFLACLPWHPETHTNFVSYVQAGREQERD